jgi:hypothetical protein
MLRGQRGEYSRCKVNYCSGDAYGGNEHCAPPPGGLDLIAPFLDRKAALARLLCDTNAGILLNEYVAKQKQKKEIG